MRPRYLYNAVFTWLVLTGGRFTAPFLEAVAGFTDTQTGLALAIQFGLFYLIGSVGGMIADRLEARSPHRGRCAVLALGMGIGTAAFLLHSVVRRFLAANGTSVAIVVHMALRAVYSVGLALIMPVLDGITLAFLEEAGISRIDYGKERLYGAVGWAISSVIVGPFIDKFGFEVMFWFAPTSFACALITIMIFSKELDQFHKPDFIDESTALIREGANSVCDADDPSVDCCDIEATDRQKPTLWRLLWLLCGSIYGLGFIFSCITLSMGTSVVENLIFLFFEELGGSNTVCGVTVVVTVLFEIPIFHLAPQFLKQFGVAKLQQLACIAYVTRVVGYTFIPQQKVLLVLFLEPFHGVTYAFSKTSRVEFVAELAPKGYEASCQGLMSTLTGLGSVVGLSVGGWAEDALGPKTMYRVLGGVVAFGFLVLMCVDCVRNEREQLSVPADNEIETRHFQGKFLPLTEKGVGVSSGSK